MKRISDKSFFLYALCGAVWAFLLYFFVMEEPLEAMRAEREAKLRRMEYALLRLDNVQNRYGDLAAYEREITAKERVAEGALPDMGRISNPFVAALEAEALATGIVLEAALPMPAERSGDIAIEPVRIRVRADYFDLLAYLRRVENGARLARVRSAKIRAKDGRLDCELEILTYAFSKRERASDEAEEKNIATGGGKQ